MTNKPTIYRPEPAIKADPEDLEKTPTVKVETEPPKLIYPYPFWEKARGKPLWQWFTGEPYTMYQVFCRSHDNEVIVRLMRNGEKYIIGKGHGRGLTAQVEDAKMKAAYYAFGIANGFIKLPRNKGNA